MKTFSVGCLLLLFILTVVSSCKKEKASTEADDQLFDEINLSGYTYYQGGSVLSPAAPSPHGSFKLRFNATAQAALDSTGELPVGSSFANGSILVKEITGGSGVSLYAVMKKDQGNENAGSGWVWAEFNPDGTAAFSVTKKGDACISCHSGSPNRDLVRTFDLH